MERDRERNCTWRLLVEALNRHGLVLLVVPDLVELLRAADGLSCLGFALGFALGSGSVVPVAADVRSDFREVSNDHNVRVNPTENPVEHVHCGLRVKVPLDLVENYNLGRGVEMKELPDLGCHY
jgi:hypothetical protein